MHRVFPFENKINSNLYKKYNRDENIPNHQTVANMKQSGWNIDMISLPKE